MALGDNGPQFSWLDAELRKEKATVAALREELDQHKVMLADQTQRLKAMEDRLAKLQGQLLRVSDVEEAIQHTRDELVLRMSEIKQDLDGGVPFLKDIPGVGAAFKHKKKISIKTELVILLKPVLVDGGLKWDSVKDNFDETIREAAH